MPRHRFPLLLSCVLIALLSVPLLSPAASKRAKDQPKPTADAPPPDAQWTLYCVAIGGPAHVEQANAAKAELVKLTHMKDWYVIHQEAESVIYYGFYRTINDPKDQKEVDRAQSDRARIAGLTDQQGNKIFQHVFFVEVSAPDPAAPPEWNLCNADGYWSLEIAAYKDSPKRKQAAVEAVREARAQGVQAYYYHGETISSVCIGAWPKRAVRTQDDTIEAPPSEQEVVVLPQSIPGLDQLQFRSRETGQRIRTVAPKNEPVDPSLIAMMQKYPRHSVNGLVMVNKVKDPVTGEVKSIEDPSFVVKIPHPENSMLAVPGQQPAAPQLLNPVGAQPTQGQGKLKSIGE
jgi:hypothetical protein